MKCLCRMRPQPPAESDLRASILRATASRAPESCNVIVASFIRLTIRLLNTS
jgi:hypothetical protein